MEDGRVILVEDPSYLGQRQIWAEIGHNPNGLMPCLDDVFHAARADQIASFEAMKGGDVGYDLTHGQATVDLLGLSLFLGLACSFTGAFYRLLKRFVFGAEPGPLSSRCR